MMRPKSILITGAKGFIGRAVVARALLESYEVHVLVRKAEKEGFQDGIQQIIQQDLGAQHIKGQMFCGIEAVIHLAAIAHDFRWMNSNNRQIVRKVNVEGTLKLAEACREAGVRRFVYVSSIGVLGNLSPNKPLVESDSPAPKNMYALSKYDTEQRLLELAGDAMEIVIVRPPLVYGVSAPGNMRKLLRLIDAEIPLPLKKVRNKRSFICRENLVGFLFLCLEHPDAAGQVFLVADDHDYSTPELIQVLARYMGKKAKLFSLPLTLLKWLLWSVGKKQLYTQLCCSLQINSEKARKLLGWKQVHTPEFALKQMAEDFVQNKKQ